MKPFLPFILAFTILSCKSEKQTDPNARATAEKMNGFYVFIKSKPQTEYEFLGSENVTLYSKLTQLNELSVQSAISNIKSLISFSDNLQTTLNQLRQKFPTADGVVFDDDMGKCEIIKFK
jgi:hypothetical protein